MEEKTAQVVALRLECSYRNINFFGGLNTLNYNIKYQK